MKKNILKISIWSLAFGFTLVSCKPEIDAPNFSKGELDLTRYVAIGNSLTAGYADDGLYREGQINSYPNILAQQFKVVGGGEFEQPLFSEQQANGTSYLRLTRLYNAQGALSPQTVRVTDKLAIKSAPPASPQVLFTKYSGNPQNLGVPGIRVSDILTQGYGSEQGNPYFERLLQANEPATTTYLDKVSSSKPTFFTCWLGNNDVLGYATSGGSTNSRPITPANDFRASYGALLTRITANNTEGVLIKIPNITNIPFFTLVGPNIKNALAALPPQLPGLVALTGTGSTRIIVARNQIRSVSGSNVEGTILFPLQASQYAPLIGTPTGKYWRDRIPASQLSQTLLFMQIDTTQAFGLSNGNPWPSELVLDNTELGNINNALTEYNNFISDEAIARNLALCDVDPLLARANQPQGIVLSGTNASAQFISGGIFSLDGIHLTPRGYSFVANEIINSINAKYKSSIPTVNEVNYRGVVFP